MKKLLILLLWSCTWINTQAQTTSYQNFSIVSEQPFNEDILTITIEDRKINIPLSATAGVTALQDSLSSDTLHFISAAAFVDAGGLLHIDFIPKGDMQFSIASTTKNNQFVHPISGETATEFTIYTEKRFEKLSSTYINIYIAAANNAYGELQLILDKNIYFNAKELDISSEMPFDEVLSRYANAINNRAGTEIATVINNETGQAVGLRLYGLSGDNIEVYDPVAKYTFSVVYSNTAGDSYINSTICNIDSDNSYQQNSLWTFYFANVGNERGALNMMLNGQLLFSTKEYDTKNMNLSELIGFCNDIINEKMGPGSSLLIKDKSLSKNIGLMFQLKNIEKISWQDPSENIAIAFQQQTNNYSFIKTINADQIQDYKDKESVNYAFYKDIYISANSVGGAVTIYGNFQQESSIISNPLTTENLKDKIIDFCAKINSVHGEKMAKAIFTDDGKTAIRLYKYQTEEYILAGSAGGVMLSLEPNADPANFPTAVTISWTDPLRPIAGITGQNECYEPNNNYMQNFVYDQSGAIVATNKVYLDRHGRAIQQLQKSFENDNILVQQNAFDGYGRATAASLVAPSFDSYMCYKPGFFTNADGTNYTATDFDKKDATGSTPIAGSVHQPRPVGNTVQGTLGYYYSDNNMQELKVPASDYPYSRATFYNDPLGRVSQVAKAGEYLNMGSGHEQTVYYANAGNMTDYIYGKNKTFYTNNTAGLSKTTFDRNINTAPQVLKTITVDENGKELISFNSTGGKQLATCVSGISESCSEQQVTTTIPEGGAAITFHIPKKYKADDLQMNVQMKRGAFATYGGAFDISNLQIEIYDIKNQRILDIGTDYVLQTNAMTVNKYWLWGSEEEVRKETIYSSGADKDYFAELAEGIAIHWLNPDVTQSSFLQISIKNIFVKRAAITQKLDYTHWTVNYYDSKNGQLSKSIPPAGFDCVYSPIVTPVVNNNTYPLSIYNFTLNNFSNLGVQNSVHTYNVATCVSPNGQPMLHKIGMALKVKSNNIPVLSAPNNVYSAVKKCMDENNTALHDPNDATIPNPKNFLSPIDPYKLYLIERYRDIGITNPYNFDYSEPKLDIMDELSAEPSIEMGGRKINNQLSLKAKMDFFNPAAGSSGGMSATPSYPTSGIVGPPVIPPCEDCPPPVDPDVCMEITKTMYNGWKEGNLFPNNVNDLKNYLTAYNYLICNNHIGCVNNSSGKFSDFKHLATFYLTIDYIATNGSNDPNPIIKTGNARISYGAACNCTPYGYGASTESVYFTAQELTGKTTITTRIRKILVGTGADPLALEIFRRVPFLSPDDPNYAALSQSFYSSDPHIIRPFNPDYWHYHDLLKLADLKLDAIDICEPSSEPAHSRATVYAYDSRGLPLAVQDPEQGITEYKYDRLGRLRFSQDAQQKVDKRFSYINYDQLDRTSDVGVFKSGNTSTIFFDNLFSTIPSLYTISGCTAVTTFLEQPLNPTAGYDLERVVLEYDVAASLSSGVTQRFVHGAVSHRYIPANTTLGREAAHTWFSYDMDGQLVYTLKSNKAGSFTMDYEYDYFGQLQKMGFNKNDPQTSYFHHFSYDKDFRLKEVSTSYDGNPANAMLHARYEYYLHGPLKRTILGNKTQGIDYVYTINGWLKSINQLLHTNDPGADGQLITVINNGQFTSIADPNAVAFDMFSENIDYFPGDYRRESTYIPNYDNSNYSGTVNNNYNIIPNIYNTLPDKPKVEQIKASYNGNIQSVQWQTLTNLQDIVPLLPQGQAGNTTPATDTRIHMQLFDYDELYQLKAAIYGRVGANGTVNNGGGQAQPMTFNPKNDYLVYNLSYDKNGNILTQKKMNYTAAAPAYLLRDQLSYSYEAGTNKLAYVTDAAAVSLQPATLKGFLSQAAGNYTYSATGQLTADNQADVTYSYNGAGKVTEIRQKSTNTLRMKYSYDDNGTRLCKALYSSSGVLQKETYYISDAMGSGMSIYEIDYTASLPQLRQAELTIVGIGTQYVGGTGRSRTFLRTVYQLTDHLGNVRATIDRNKEANGQPKLYSNTDYYVGGSPMPGMSLNPPGSSGSRYGYQGQEYDAETGLYSFSLRQYNSDLMRWLTPDPYGQHHSPYLAMSNNPVSFIDPDGGEDVRNGFSWTGINELNTVVIIAKRKIKLEQRSLYPISGTNTDLLDSELYADRGFEEPVSYGKSPNDMPKDIDIDRLAKLTNQRMDMQLQEEMSTASNWKRLTGVLQAGGGIAEIFVGGVGGVATAETGIGAAVGYAIVMNGIDNTVTGLKQAWTGRSENTMLHKGVAATAKLAGANNGTAENIATTADVATIALGGYGSAKSIGKVKLINTTANTSTQTAEVVKQLPIGTSKFPRYNYKFGKHAVEWSQWGSISKTAYYNRAIRLAESQIGGKILGFTSKEGTIFRFNNATGEFVTKNPNGYIETFFRPTEGLTYYLKQVKLYGE